MNIIELGEKVNKSNKHYVDYEALCNEFNFDYYNLDYENTSFYVYWIAPWYCTDTYVGYLALYLNDTLLAIIVQYSRKDDTIFFWKSRDEYNMAKEELLRWMDPPKINTVVDFPPATNILQESGYRIFHSSNLLSDTVLYKGVRCKVVLKPIGYTDGPIKIDYNGDIITVDIKECIIPYNCID